jgi:hypothetical protein
MLPEVTGPESGKGSADPAGMTKMKTAIPSRILRRTESINSSGAVLYRRKAAVGKKKIQKFFARGVTASQPVHKCDGCPNVVPW